MSHSTIRPKPLFGGLILFVVGCAGMALLIVAAYGQSAACQALSLRLGIVMTLLISALAQSFLLFGAALIWHAVEPVRRRAQRAGA